MTDKPDAPATDRNRESILEVLRVEFEHSRSVLEIGSGTGQHAIFFGREFPSIHWQTSDRRENHDGINAWISDSTLRRFNSPSIISRVARICPQYAIHAPIITPMKPKNTSLIF